MPGSAPTWPPSRCKVWRSRRPWRPRRRLRPPLSDEARKPWWEHIPTFFREKPQNEENRANYEREFERLAAVIGKDRPLGEIRRADLDAYHDHILAVGKPRKGNTVLSAKSQERCLSHIKSFFSWAYLKEWIERDPSARISPKGLRPAEIVAKPRRPFTPQELTHLFHAPLFTGCKGPHRIKEAGTYLHRGGKYWLPLLAVWTGGRLRELTDLKVSDLARWGDLWYLTLAIIPDPTEGDEVPQDEVTEEENAPSAKRRQGKSQKTPHAKRLAPLHPDLLALGFLEFVEGRREAGGADALLFDEVGDYGPVFNRDEFDKERVVKGILASIGIKYHDTSFHSFRHVFADALRDSGLDSRLQDRLMGHAPKGAAKHYGSPLTPGEAAQFAVLRQCISLDHLLPANRGGRVMAAGGGKHGGGEVMASARKAGTPRKVKLVPGRLRNG